MPATFSKRFGSGRGTVLDVQATAITGITDISVTGVKMTSTESEPKRTAAITITIDSDDILIELEFLDESFNSVGITGGKLNAPAPL